MTALAATDAGPASGRMRAIGWLAVAGVIATIAAAFVPWFVYSDGTGERLIDDDWYELWVLCVGGLAACAAFSLLGQGRSRGTGIVLILGIAPTAAAGEFGLAGTLTDAYEYNDGHVGAGFFIVELGLFAFVAAAVLAAASCRRYLALAAPPAARRAAVTAMSAIIGVGAALGLGELTVVGYGIADLDVPPRRLWELALRLLLLTTIGCVMSRWLHDHGVRGRPRIVGTVLLYALVVLAFLIATDPTTALNFFILAWYASLVVGAAVVPVVSTLVLPRRRGAVLLAAWAVGFFAESARYIWDGTHTAGRTVLTCSLLAAVALAAALWSWTHVGPRSGRFSSASA